MTPQEIAAALVDEVVKDLHAYADRMREKLEAAVYQAGLPADAPARTYEDGWRAGVEAAAKAVEEIPGGYCHPDYDGGPYFLAKRLRSLSPPSDSRDQGERPTPRWFPEDDPPINPGWYAVQRADGSLCLRAYGNGEWWIPLKDGWLSGLPPGFRWMGPVEPVEWDTPRSDPTSPSPSADPEVTK